MEIRQAEFLVREFAPLAAMRKIAVCDNEAERRVRAALEGTGWDPIIEVRPGWYF